MDHFERVVPCCKYQLNEEREAILIAIDDIFEGPCCEGIMGLVPCDDDIIGMGEFDRDEPRRAQKSKKQRGSRRLLQQDEDDFVETPPALIGAPDSLAGNSEMVAVLNVSQIAANGMTVMVNALLNNQPNNVMIQIVKMTVEELLNDPMFCCIKSVRTRVMLESMLAEALDAYEKGECKKAIKILRMLMQKMTLLLCDLDREEKACIEKALRRLNDTARLIAIRCCGADPMGTYIREGDYFRRAGLYEAALVEYSRSCK